MKFRFLAEKTYELLAKSRAYAFVAGSVLSPIGGMIGSAANENAGVFN